MIRASHKSPKAGVQRAAALCRGLGNPVWETGNPQIPPFLCRRRRQKKTFEKPWETFKEEIQDMAHCTECEAAITLQGFIVGEIIYCPDCNTELEVLGLEPPA